MYSEENLILQLAGLGAPQAGDMMGEQVSPRGDTWGLHGYPLASVYAPLQEWRDAYGEEEALSRGTLFCELYKPFLGGKE